METVPILLLKGGKDQGHYYNIMQLGLGMPLLYAAWVGNAPIHELQHHTICWK